MKDLRRIVKGLAAIPKELQKYLLLNTQAIELDLEETPDFVRGALAMENIIIPTLLPDTKHEKQIAFAEQNTLNERKLVAIVPEQITPEIEAKKLNHIFDILQFLRNSDNIYNGRTISDRLNIPYTEVLVLLKVLKENKVTDYNQGPNRSHIWRIANHEYVLFLLRTQDILLEECIKAAQKGQPVKDFIKDRIDQMYAEDSNEYVSQL